jgi:hypothetical protein
MSALTNRKRQFCTRSEGPVSARYVEHVQQTFPAQALNRFAIGALVVGVVLNRDLFRVL